MCAELPPEFVRTLQSQKVTSGESAGFEIELSKGDAVVKWFRNGQEIDATKEGERFQLQIDGKVGKRNLIFAAA